MTEEKNIKLLKTSVISSLVAIVFFMGGFAFIIKRNHENLAFTDIKVKSLQNQVRILSEENERIRESITEENKNLRQLATGIASLKTAIASAFEDNKEDLEYALNEARSELTSIEQKLKKDIEAKELTINELVQKNIKLKNELVSPEIPEDVMNFLLLGENQGLTDTIIIASVNPTLQTVTLINIPRDLFYKGHKINELNSYYGIDKLYQAVNEITGLNIKKHAIFSFDAFVKVVDGLGGIDIDVEKPITDNQYPGPNYSYTLVSFEKGLQHMDGETALKYVRSRKSTNDFDRGARQQQVITALKHKVNNLNLISQLPAYVSLYEGVQSLIKTDVGALEALAYYDKYKNYTVESGNVLSSSNFLYSKIAESGQYILLPAGGNYAKIKNYVSDLVNS